MHTALDDWAGIGWTNLEQIGELAAAIVYEWAKNPPLRVKKAARALAKEDVVPATLAER